MPNQLNSVPYKYLDIVTALFAVILVTSNIASSAKIVSLGFSVFGMPLVFDGGTLLFPLSYVLGDILTEVYGFRAARRVIWTGFACLALCAALFFILRLLPGDPVWQEYAGNEAYEAILGGMSAGGIVLSSLAAYLVGSFSNAIVLSKMKVMFKNAFLWTRTLGSSVIGHFLDSLVFVTIASLTGVFGWELFTALVITNCLLKLSLEVIVTPLVYLSVNKLKKAEGVDVFDTGIKYRLF